MHVHHDLVAECSHTRHRYSETVARSRLHDILDQLSAVGLCFLPLLRRLVHAHVDDGLPSGHVVLPESCAPVAELPTARQFHEEVAVHVAESDAVPDPDGPVLTDGCLGCHLAGPPELRDGRVGRAPCVDDALQFFLRDLAFAVHGLHRSDAALVSAGQLCDLALLPEISVDAVLYDRHVVHLGRRRAVDVAAIAEGLKPPLLAGDPADHAGLDGGEVRHHEAAAVRRYKGRPHEL